ncbi:MAG: hypothetical protein AABY64_00335 [Bdellovibrionota bacterium]
MTELEFKREYKKLEDVFPQNFNSKFKEEAIANYIKDMDVRWWKALVNRMILSSNPRLDIDDAARGERIAKKRAEDTRAMLQLNDQLNEKISEDGLNNVLKNLGAKSLEEAVIKNKNNEGA